MAFTDPIDITTPVPEETQRLGDDRIRETKRAIQELLNVDHVADLVDDKINSTDSGLHKQVTLQERTSPVTADENMGIVHVKEGTETTQSELSYTDDNSNVTEITRGGVLRLDNGRLNNDTPIIADNAADDGTIDLIKAAQNVAADTDVAQLPDFPRTPTAYIPLEDTELANKKYVDDAVSAAVSAALPDDDAFGPWTNKDSDNATLIKNIIYRVGSDGFVSGYPSSNFILQFFTDASSSPGTKRTGAHNHTGSVHGGFFCAVKKDEYWKVTVNSGTPTLYWLPIGTGACVK